MISVLANAWIARIQPNVNNAIADILSSKQCAKNASLIAICAQMHNPVRYASLVFSRIKINQNA